MDARIPPEARTALTSLESGVVLGRVSSRLAVAQTPQQNLEDGLCGRATFAASAVAGNTELRFSLRGSTGMADQLGVHHLRGWKRQRGWMNGSDKRCWTIWAFLSGCLELRMTAGKLTALRHAHHAVMLTIATATRRQIRLTLRREREERGSEGQTEYSQQRDCDELAQCFH